MKISSAEWKRKSVHAGMGLFALTLRWLDWKIAALLALVALLFNLFAMPRLGRGIYRDQSRRWDTGIVAYAAMVLALVLLFRGRYLPIAAAVWAMMAFGDSAATIAGRRIGSARLPWNHDKTWAGLLANWSVGGLAAVFVFWFVASRLEPASVAILLAGAVLYAFLESVRSGVDDNLVAAIPTGLVLFQLSSPWAGSRWPGFAGTSIAIALGANALVGAATRQIGLVSTSGAVAGAVAGFLVVVFGGWSAYAVLWFFFLIGTAATKWGYRRKVQRGVAQSDRGRRGAAHVVANVGVPVALLALGARPVAFAAALAAALADTLGTEIGALYGRRPFSLLRWQRLTAGAPGAVSGSGLAAGALGAASIGTVAFMVHLIPASAIVAVVFAGVAGSVAESAAHDLSRQAGVRLDHDFANAFNTLVGALVALEIVLSIERRSLFLPAIGS